MELSPTHLEGIEDIIALRLLMRANGTSKQLEQEKRTDLHEQTAQQITNAPDFVKLEKNLASLGFFTPSSKKIKNAKAKTITFNRFVDGKRIDAKVTIAPAALYGLPVTSDQDKYIAFQKIVADIKQETGTVRNPIGFTSATLLRLLGKRVRTGKNYLSVSEWLDVMTSTTIISEGTVYFAGKKTFAKDRFHVFERAVSTGKELSDGEIADKNYVWLSEWQLENINNNYLLPVDFEEYKQLTNHIAKALVPLLQIWLYASREEGVFEKRYDELCEYLDLRQYQYVSKIKEKVSPALDELVAHGYLSNWKIEKTADKKSYKIIFYHGDKFYQDRATQLTRGNQPKNAPPLREKKPEASQLPFDQKDGTKSQNFSSGVKSEIDPNPQITENLPDTLTDNQREVIKQLFVEFGISIEKGTELVKADFEETKKQLEVYPFRNIQPKNKGGFLIQAVEERYNLPESYYAHLREKDDAKAQIEEKRKQEVSREERKAQIKACQLCDEKGQRFIKHPENHRYSALHECTHNEEIESKLENW